MNKQKRKISSKEIWSWTNLCISCILVILLLVGLGDNPLKNTIFQFLGATYVMFGFGYWVYIGTYKEWFKSHSLGMDTLVTIGSLVPYFYSLYLAIEEWMGNVILFSPFFSTSATIILIVSIGETINGTLQKKLNSKITDLNEKKAQTANLIKADNNIEVIAAKNLKINDLIIVKKGGIVPADAILISDYANIDESIFNGEINYSLKTRNEIIYGGVINTSDAIKLKVVSLYKDSMINQLIKKAQRIQGAKLSVTKKIDKIAAWFIPVVILLAIMFFLIQFYCGNNLPNLLIKTRNINWSLNRTSIAIYYAIGVVVGVCPCVFGIAIPIVAAASSSKFLKHGILLNKASSFDSIKNIKAIAFDKTGTITEGKFKIEHIHGLDKYKYIFYALSKLSNHPLSLSFTKAIEEEKHNLSNINIKDFEEIPGIGLSAVIDGKQYKIVSPSYVAKNHVTSVFNLCPINKPLITFSYLIEENEIVLEVEFIDAIKESSYEAIKELKYMGYKTYLITGDNDFNAKYLQQQLGFDEVYSKVLPSQKSDIIKKIQEKYNVIFVGDGLNDIEALQQADVSIAMNSGNNISKSVSDFIVLDDDIKSVVDSIKIIKQAIKTININLIWALFYNLLVAPLAGVGIIFPIVSAILMGFSDFILVNNSFIFKAIPIFWHEGKDKHQKELYKSN